MKRIIPAGLCAVFLLTACSSRSIDRGIEPPESIRMELLESGRGIVRSLLCDVLGEGLTPAEWERILKSEIFQKKTDRYDIRIPRIPPLIFVRIMIRNTWKYPIWIEDISLVHGSESVKPLDQKTLLQQMPSPMYALLNWDQFLSPRRVAVPPETEIIEYNTDTILTTLDFIPSDDTVMRFLAFPWIPVQERKFTLRIAVTDGRDKKIIDFDFTRFEYRSSGKIFLKPAKKDRHEN